MFPGGASGKEPTYQYRRHKRRGFNPWVRKIPWRRAWQPTPVFLPGESHRGSWWATVRRVTKSRTRLKQLTHTHTHAHAHHLLCSVLSHVQLFLLRGCSPPVSFVHGDSPGKNTGVGCQALLQEIFLTHGLNSCLLHSCIGIRFSTTTPTWKTLKLHNK